MPQKLWILLIIPRINVINYVSIECLKSDDNIIVIEVHAPKS